MTTTEGTQTQTDTEMTPTPPTIAERADIARRLLTRAIAAIDRADLAHAFTLVDEAHDELTVGLARSQEVLR